MCVCARANECVRRSVRWKISSAQNNVGGGGKYKHLWNAIEWIGNNFTGCQRESVRCVSVCVHHTILHLCISNSVQSICFYYTPCYTHFSLQFQFKRFSFFVCVFVWFCCCCCWRFCPPASFYSAPTFQFHLYTILNLNCRMLLFIIKASHLKYSRCSYYPSLIKCLHFYGCRMYNVQYICVSVFVDAMALVCRWSLCVLCQHFELMCVRLIRIPPEFCNIDIDAHQTHRDGTISYRMLSPHSQLCHGILKFLHWFVCRHPKSTDVKWKFRSSLYPPSATGCCLVCSNLFLCCPVSLYVFVPTFGQFGKHVKHTLQHTPQKICIVFCRKPDQNHRQSFYTDSLSKHVSENRIVYLNMFGIKVDRNCDWYEIFGTKISQKNIVALLEKRGRELSFFYSELSCIRKRSEVKIVISFISFFNAQDKRKHTHTHTKTIELHAVIEFMN